MFLSLQYKPKCDFLLTLHYWGYWGVTGYLFYSEILHFPCNLQRRNFSKYFFVKLYLFFKQCDQVVMARVLMWKRPEDWGVMEIFKPFRSQVLKMSSGQWSWKTRHFAKCYWSNDNWIGMLQYRDLQGREGQSACGGWLLVQCACRDVCTLTCTNRGYQFTSQGLAGPVWASLWCG